MVNLKNRCYILLPIRKQSRLLLILSLCCVTVFMSSCVREITSKKISTRSPQRKSYAKLHNYLLELEVLTARRRFYAGEDAKITYRLKNLGRKSLRINEWYMNEPDNIRLYYMPYRPKLTSFNPKEWILIEPEYKKPTNRFELVMSPKNMVLIDKSLPFVKAAGEDTPSVKRGKYYLVAELTLNSVNVRSKPIIISIP